jgi:hypothetical protein
MSGGLNRAFISNPKQFMRTHILEMAWGNLARSEHTGIKQFDLTIASGIRCRLESYTTNSFGQAKTHGGRSHTISAYWLPFKENKRRTIRLDNQANYFFTATLTGCSLVIGSGANPFVSHINYQTGAEGATVIDQGRINQSILDRYGTDGGATTFTKDDYWDDSLDGVARQAYTVVGVRRPAGWKFYAQGYSKNGPGGDQIISACVRIR